MIIMLIVWFNYFKSMPQTIFYLLPFFIGIKILNKILKQNKNGFIFAVAALISLLESIIPALKNNAYINSILIYNQIRNIKTMHLHINIKDWGS